MRPDILLMRLARQVAGMAQPSPEYIKAIHEWYAGKGWLFTLVGTAKKEKLLEDFLYVKQRYNVDTFVIDSLLKCGIAEDDYNGQKLFVERLCDFKNEHNIHVHLVAHPRKGEDEMTPPNKMNVKGSGSITDLADNVFTIWRNKRKERGIDKAKNDGTPVPIELQEEYDALWICEKQRNGDWEKAISLWFDQASLQFLNYKAQKPRQYVQYSNLNR
jgi:twinkle protein